MLKLSALVFGQKYLFKGDKGTERVLTLETTGWMETGVHNSIRSCYIKERIKGRTLGTVWDKTYGERILLADRDSDVIMVLHNIAERSKKANFRLAACDGSFEIFTPICVAQ